MGAFLSRISFLAKLRAGMFTQAHRGGPGRLLTIAGIGVLMIGLVFGVSMLRNQEAIELKVAKIPPINPLPGGLQSTPAQDALLVRHSREKAAEAAAKQEFYTPAIPASAPLKIIGATAPNDEVAETTRSENVIPPPVPVPVPPPPYVAPDVIPEDQYIQKASTATSGEESDYKKAVSDLFKGWEGRPPHTDVILTPAADLDGPLTPRTHFDGTGAAAVPAAGRIPVVTVPEIVLVPAGRGVYAHTILSVSSDSGGPIVLEGDSGPLAGDRMIGTFSKNERDRLIVRITTVNHRGQSLDVRGLAIAPDSMETAIASSVDEHYIERFALPAAAAFVSGLGQAIALSNSTTQLSPYGTALTSYGPLNLKQQAGIAAGAAAAQVGQTLQQETPKGPTVNLAANVGVGVIFLSNVVVAAPPAPANYNTK